MADYLVPWINSEGQGGLRNSMLVSLSDGSTTVYAFNFAGGYISKADIKAYVYDPVQGTTTDYAITSGMWQGEQQIALPAPVPVGQYFVIYRDTQKTLPLVSFVNGAILNEPNLDEMARQAIFAVAEMVDRFSEINASSSLAINNAAQAILVANAAADASTSATATANSAAAQASSADSKANAAVSTANAAKVTADGIDAKAQSALDASAASVTTANAANATANGIDAKATKALTDAGTAVTTANKASTDAGTAITTANTVSGKADGAVSTANAAKTAADAATAAASGALQKAGGDMTGYLTLDQNMGGGINLKWGDNTNYVILRGAPAVPGAVFTDAAGTHVLRVNTDKTVQVVSGRFIANQAATINGRVTITNGQDNASAGEVTLQHVTGWRHSMRSRDGGGMEWINNAYNAVIGLMDDGGNVQFGQMQSRGRVIANEHLWSLNNVYAGNGNAFIGTDGNLYGSIWGGYLSNWMGNKADRNATCQFNSGLLEIGSAESAAPTQDMPAPYVMIGVRITTSGEINRIYPRGVFLRNN
jgi:Phage T7 tail fibre protein